jgi:hypothetical protein
MRSATTRLELQHDTATLVAPTWERRLEQRQLHGTRVLRLVDGDVRPKGRASRWWAEQCVPL